MSLKEKLAQDLKSAMKQKDTIRKNTVQLVRSGVLQIEKDKQIELDDSGVLDVIVKELKKRRDALPDYERSGRTDLVQDLNQEIQVLLEYLPEQLDENKARAIVVETINEVEAKTIKDMGKVMAALTPKVKGKADSKFISNIVKEILQK